MNHLVVQVPCDQDDTILLSVDVVRSRFLDNFVILFILIQKQGSFIYWKKKNSSATETKLEAILFCSEVNNAGYSEIQRNQSDCAKTSIHL